jgi:hypothetical protein
MAQLKGAIAMSQRQQKNHDEFTATFSIDTIQKWQQIVEDWNANQKASNPYIEPVVGKYSISYKYFYDNSQLIILRHINYESSPGDRQGGGNFN